ncbi:MAG: UbiA family prenyltransferase [Saprospirales bacterium]|nr:UbiA family prenyltransferase [Saprospirales bacterium]
MSFIQNIQQRLLGNVLYKISLIFCSIYVVLFYSKKVNLEILICLLISILLSVGVAGLGYVMNDVKDYKDDFQNNKPNLFNKFSKIQSVLLIIVFTILSTFPWFYLPKDRNTFYLLAIEFALFFIYAFPPFRLKEKGFLGILTDALYAQVVPCLLAVYTFSKIGNTILNTKLIILYEIWLLFVGIRNIIKHQVEDFDNDNNTKTKTFATKHGVEYSKKLCTKFLFPIEFLLFLSLLLIIKTPYFIVLLSYLFYIAILFIKRNKTTEIDLFYFINMRIFNEFYEIHLPIILLVCFCFSNAIFIFILGFNLLIFSPIYLSYLKGFLNKYSI